MCNVVSYYEYQQCMTGDVLGSRSPENKVAYPGGVESQVAQPDLINEVFAAQNRLSIYNPEIDELATLRLKKQVKDWRDAGEVVVMTFGCYDGQLHANHKRSLFDIKLQGVAHFYEMYSDSTDVPWNFLSVEDKLDFTNWAFAREAVKLIVSIDGNEQVNASKGFNAEKGGSIRPLFDWSDRADQVLGFGLRLDDSVNHRAPVVDCVTMHDRITLPGSVHARPVDLVATLQPNIWTIYHESTTDINLASEDTRLQDTKIVVLDNTNGYDVMDPLTGQRPSTSNFIRRIRGE